MNAEIKVVKRNTKTKQKDFVVETEAAPRVTTPPVQNRKFGSIAENVAQDSLFYKNHYFTGSRIAFEGKPRCQTVDKFFPYAEGGELYVDEPMHPYQEQDCALKAEYFKKHNMRYLVIKKGMSYLDCLEAIA